MKRSYGCPGKEPREMGREVLERVLGYSDYHARDDMTVVVQDCGKNEVFWLQEKK